METWFFREAGDFDFVRALLAAEGAWGEGFSLGMKMVLFWIRLNI